MEATLYTIGYEGLTQIEFLEWLQKYRISVVADVRYLPLSRKKGFSKKALFEFLENENINYLNYRNLGADKQLRNQLKEDGNYKTFFQKISESISGHQDQLFEINQMLCDGKNVALMCFEKDYQFCHRKIVAQGIQEVNANGLKIKHLSI